MRKLIFAVAALAVLGCGRPSSSPSWSNASGSVALSRDDELVYAVDTDNGIVAVHDALTLEKIADVKVGRSPQQIAVASDDVLYVANRGDRSVSIIRRDEWQAVRTVATAVEPVGLAVSPDAKTLYVVNSTSLESAAHGTVLAIDTPTLQRRWELPVGEEPRSIALVGDGSKALVTLFKRGDVALIDLAQGSVIQNNADGEHTAVYAKANESKLLPAGSPQFGFSFSSTFQARSAGNVVVSPDGRKAHMAVTWSREEPILLSPTVSGGYYSSGGPCNTSAIAIPGIVTYEAETAEPEVDDLTDCTGSKVAAGAPRTSLGRGFGSRLAPIQGSAAQVVDPTGAWLFIANRESNNVAITPTSRRPEDGEPVSHLIPVGAAPDGIAITRDGRRVFVYSQLSHQLSVLVKPEQGEVAVGDRVTVAVDPPTLSAAFLAGRRLFFDATHRGLTDPVNTGIACNTCHTEGGREDGHVWGFPDGFRQTPALAGRMMSATAPFHWSGEFSTLSAFIEHTTVLRMGGAGLTSVEATSLAAFMDGAPAADNPHRLASPSDAQLRGAQVFQQASCGTCHAGEALTLNNMANVGTIRGTDQISAVNTPSLLGLARTAPYLHDGSAPTLRERIYQGREWNLHGETSRLTDAQIDDLVAYLSSL